MNIGRLFEFINRKDIYYNIRRSFGKTVKNCSITTTMYLYQMFPTEEKYKKSDQERNAELLVAGLCYNVCSFGVDYDNADKAYVRFETLIGRMYKEASESSKKTIEQFLDRRFDTDGYFSKTFVHIANRAVKYLKANERISYLNLLKDLVKWDRATKDKWSKTIATNE